jgi:hypothetical protein
MKNYARAYEYFDKQNNKFKNIFNDIIFTLIENKDVTRFEIFKNDNKIGQADCNTIGIFNNENSIWYWSWCLPFNNKNENYLSKKILDYAFNIDINNNNNEITETAIFKSEFLNSKIYMVNPSIELEKFLAISMYITQAEYYYIVPIDNLNVKTNSKEINCSIYYILKNIQIY